MTIYNLIVIISWLAMISVWLISAFTKKKVIQPENNWRRLGLPFAIVILYILSTRFFNLNSIPHDPILQIIGTIFCVAGVSFAIWARIYLGRNWNSAPSVQQNHELVTDGPYKYVRHPIYTGILLAILGSVLVDGSIWIIFFLVIGAEFIRRISVEEKLMTKTFPNTYPKYVSQTKALIPFVW